MKLKPNPLLYGAELDFCSSFRIALTLRQAVEVDRLRCAVAKAAVRYPYFCVTPTREGETLVLRTNPRPIAVFPDDRTVTLGSEQSNGHLMTFGCRGRTLFLDASHYLADGMGIHPLLLTVLHGYLSLSGACEDVQSACIRQPDEPIPAAEYAYPFPAAPRDAAPQPLPRRAAEEVYRLPRRAGENDYYAYCLHVPQREMMAKANPSDGSPVSFLSVLLYRAMLQCDAALSQTVVGYVQHQYRAALGTPQSHYNQVCYLPVRLSPRAAGMRMEQQNTVLRGQIILGSEREADLGAVDRLLSAFAAGGETYAGRRRAMADYARKSIDGKTFGISYVGRADWCGMERYVEDMQVYLGEKDNPQMLLLEVLTVGEDFSLTWMQCGRDRRLADAFVDQLRQCGIPCRLAGEGSYALCDTQLPD